MPTCRHSMRGAHDLLLVCSVALAMIGLAAVAAELVNHAQVRPANLATASDATGSDSRDTLSVFDWRACACGWWSAAPRNRSALAPVPDAMLPESPFLRDGGRANSAPPDEPAARRTYLLGSSAVAHRRVWVHEYVATPPAAELQALTSGSWQP